MKSDQSMICPENAATTYPNPRSILDVDFGIAGRVGLHFIQPVHKILGT